jgi:hypothetical protein
MDEGKILIVNLAKGVIGEDNSAILGSLLVTMFYLSAVSRASVPEEKRKSFYLYVDEFHNFVSLTFADILSEARKYGLYLILAHQYIAQLHEKVRSGIFGNVGTIISFRIGLEDALLLSPEFRPAFDETDLVNLPNYHIYLKLMVDGVTSQPFSGLTLPLPGETLSDSTEIIRESRRRYGRLRNEVEQTILMQHAPVEGTTDRQNRLL